MILNDKKINNLKSASKVLKLSDGGGLFIQVSPQGSKLWRMAYRFNGHQKLLSFGAYPAVGLAAARLKRDAAKKLLASEVDPAFHAKQEKLARLSAGKNTFESVAEEFLRKNEREGKAGATLNKKRWLVSLALPALGKRPVGEITASEILVPLKKVEALGNFETANACGLLSAKFFALQFHRHLLKLTRLMA